MPPALKGREAQGGQGTDARSSCLTHRSISGRCPTSHPSRCVAAARGPPGLPPTFSSSKASRRRPGPGPGPGPLHAAPRRDPAALPGAPGSPGRLPLPSPHDSLPTGGTLSTAKLVFVVSNFCVDGEKKVCNNTVIYLKPKHALW